MCSELRKVSMTKQYVYGGVLGGGGWGRGILV